MRIRKGISRGIVRHALPADWETFDQICARIRLSEGIIRTTLRYLVNAGEVDARWTTAPRRRQYRRAAR